MHSIVYLSTASEPMGTESLNLLLEVARARNADAGVSGILIYGDGCFIQILEGELQPLEAIFRSILRDGRHYGVKTIQFEPVDGRRFGDWSMAFVDDDDLTPTDRADLAQLRGQAEILARDEKGDPEFLAVMMRAIAPRLARHLDSRRNAG
ncbi:MAG: BLUF domain-containing protein [Minwuia sp.]|uniref:BLUF domain-containing protein n=1 Tax=Minwuia sp. TaxID=2493630 RepID=UPI003A8B8386